MYPNQWNRNSETIVFPAVTKNVPAINDVFEFQNGNKILEILYEFLSYLNTAIILLSKIVNSPN